ncbi:TetR/AcrR family transcriptional regulator [Lactococcus protaetiae]|uniref:TetR/AcrR family transcriptional regulator n=1 Tax=Lactococcus protaetiae TaxID=2592653 RepID=A0A514Z9Y7_9LACT|nr:TetR/AcrR family transcriptional regulator [Lactococcus protaetiae]MCL2113895.1 TetR/AcrR family transcriptional regulator [Streptococcaceae bacterium]QDK71398.1 TetR/AcrR family transcriptional regulator [Lactococcus protaetiae]
MNQTEKKKKAILDTTFTLLNEKEIKEITVDEIAQKAVVSKVTLFKYYKNKNHLMNIVIMHAFENMAAQVEEIIQSDLNFEETYEGITQMKLKQLEHYSPIFSQNLMTQYSESPDFFDTDAVTVQMKIYDKLFQKGQDEGKISKDFTKDDFLFLVNIFISGMKGLSADYLFQKTGILTRFFINGLK